MNGSGFTPRQRRIILLLVLIVVFVFAMLAGLIITSLQSLDRVAVAVTPSLASSSPTAPPTATPAPASTRVPEEGIWSQVRAARLFDQIAHQVETKRGLSPRAEVPLSFLNEDEMTAILRQLYTERAPEIHLLPYTALGLLPDAPISVQAHASAGVYVPEQEQLYVAIDRPESDVDAQMLLAHAYVHALQDQHFDLEGMDARARTVDQELAVQALIEGDATLLTALYSYSDLATADWGRLTEPIVQAENPDYGEALGRSEAWARLRRFPNWEGRQFVEALFQAGGWEAADRAYTDPPRSAEQVLHPSRYLEERDAPVSVVVPDLSAVLGQGWTVLLEETLGEFVIGLYLDETLPDERAWWVADGWDGDTFVVWQREGGRRLLVWRTIWDSTVEATEFEQALAALIPQRYIPVRAIDPPQGLPGRWWEVDGGAMHVCRTARHVLFVQAPDVNTLANVVEVLP